jgi:hypothetical protein
MIALITIKVETEELTYGKSCNKVAKFIWQAQQIPKSDPITEKSAK